MIERSLWVAIVLAALAVTGIVAVAHNPLLLGLPGRETCLREANLDCIADLMVKAAPATRRSGDDTSVARALIDIGRFADAARLAEHFPRELRTQFEAEIARKAAAQRVLSAALADPTRVADFAPLDALASSMPAAMVDGYFDVARALIERGRAVGDGRHPVAPRNATLAAILSRWTEATTRLPLKAHSQMWVSLAETLWSIGDVDGARAALERAAPTGLLRPRIVAAWMKLGDLDRAFLLEFPSDRQNRKALLRFAEQFAAAGRPARARSLLVPILAGRRSSFAEYEIDLLARVSRLQYRLGDPAAARHTAEAALAIHRGEKGADRYDLTGGAALFIDVAAPDRARALLEETLRSLPTEVGLIDAAGGSGEKVCGTARLDSYVVAKVIVQYDRLGDRATALALARCLTPRSRDEARILLQEAAMSEGRALLDVDATLADMEPSQQVVFLWKMADLNLWRGSRQRAEEFLVRGCDRASPEVRTAHFYWIVQIALPLGRRDLAAEAARGALAKRLQIKDPARLAIELGWLARAYKSMQDAAAAEQNP